MIDSHYNFCPCHINTLNSFELKENFPKEEMPLNELFSLDGKLFTIGKGHHVYKSLQSFQSLVKEKKSYL